MISDERLKEIELGAFCDELTEGPAMARELLVLRERNRRIAIAALSGNQRAVYREYARLYSSEGDEA